MYLPQFHETMYRTDEVVNLQEILDMPRAPGHAALRSYATGRRLSATLGVMPQPVAKIANRRLWRRVDIAHWLRPT